ncbi:MAG: carboxypeptidase-like regulatory domain-containing protein [Spirochaetota bacterium]
MKIWKAACLIIALFPVSSLLADTLELVARTENQYQQAENRLFSADQGMFLWGRANFCINEALPKNGLYYFRFEVTSPTGVQVFRKESERRPVPTNPMYIELREYVVPANFFTVHGQYTLTVSFVEEYGSSTLQVNQSYPFEVLSGSRLTDLTNAPMLLQPADGATVTNYPTFNWTRVPNGSKYNIYISENPRPNEYIYAKQEGISNQEYYYNSPLPLRPGVRYYWNVRVTDNTGTPVGLNDGFSPTFSFTVNDIGVSETINPIYPRQKIEDAMPKFRWTTVFPMNVPAEYTLSLSERIAENTIWQYSSSRADYQYQAEAPILKKNVPYIWRVSGKNRLTGEVKLSEQVSFVYSPTIDPSDDRLNSDATSVRGFVVNDRDIAVMGATVYLKQLNAAPGTLAHEVSLLSGSGGTFSVAEIPAGKYRLYTEIKMAERYNNYSAEIQILEGVQNNLRIVMKNNLGRRTFTVVDERGWPVANANVVLKNNAYTWKFKTDHKGEYTLDIEDGMYSYEVSLLPEYGRVYQNQVYLTGVGNQTVRIFKTKNGAARLKVTEAGTNMGIENMQIEGSKRE